MRAVFTIPSNDAKVLYDAICAEQSFTDRSSVKVSVERKILTVEIDAKDFNALRSASTSYLRMLAAAKDTLEVLP